MLLVPCSVDKSDRGAVWVQCLKRKRKRSLDVIVELLVESPHLCWSRPLSHCGLCSFLEEHAGVLLDDRLQGETRPSIESSVDLFHLYLVDPALFQSAFLPSLRDRTELLPVLVVFYNFRLSSLASTNDVLCDALVPPLPPSGRRRTPQRHGAHTLAITLGVVDRLNTYRSMLQCALMISFPVFKSTFYQALQLPSS